MKKIKKGDEPKNPILSLYENENLKRGDSKKQTKKNTMSLCKNEKIKKGDGLKTRGSPNP
jgi:hypothetical protein